MNAEGILAYISLLKVSISHRARQYKSSKVLASSSFLLFIKPSIATFALGLL